MHYRDARAFSRITSLSRRHNTMEQESKKKDKKRSCNCDSSDVALLRELVEKNISVIRDRQINTLTNKMMKDAWRSITMETNTMGLH